MPSSRLTFLLIATFLSSSLLSAPAVAASEELGAADKCRRVLSAKARQYSIKRERLLMKCAGKLLKCELKFDVEGTDTSGCLDRATNACKRQVGPAADSALNKAITRFIDPTNAACTDFGLPAMLSNGAGGLWFANDTSCGTETVLADFLDCLRQELDAQADEVVGRTIPRAGLLLDNAGVGNEFPDLPRPPTVDVQISATAPESCVLDDDPNTITPQPTEAIRFTGDPATLPVGGGKNGKLTIRVGTGIDPCEDSRSIERVLREPYDAPESATFGPFESNRAYCVTLRDSGGCETQFTGTIDVQ